MPAEYSDIITDHGVIRIVHEMTLGEIAIVSVLALILLFLVIKTLIRLIWR